MLFHKFLRALMEAWGHKPKGTTVWELLKEVWQNLPFGIKKQFVEIVPMADVVATVDYGEIQGVNLDGNIPRFKEGETYIVNCDGVEYHCTVRYNSQGGEATVIGFGNGTLFDRYWEVVEDVPFYFLSTYDGNIRNTVYFAEPGNHTFSVTAEKEVVTPLDLKFVDSNAVVFTESGNEYSCNKTYEECVEMFNNCNITGILKVKGFGVTYLMSAHLITLEGKTLFFTWMRVDEEFVLGLEPDGSIFID